MKSGCYVNHGLFVGMEISTAFRVYTPIIQQLEKVEEREALIKLARLMPFVAPQWVNMTTLLTDSLRNRSSAIFEDFR